MRNERSIRNIDQPPINDGPLNVDQRKAQIGFSENARAYRNFNKLTEQNLMVAFDFWMQILKQSPPKDGQTIPNMAKKIVPLLIRGVERQNAIPQNFDVAPALKIAIKTCPSRRPARLLDTKTVERFYDPNPTESDAIDLMLATQEIIWEIESRENQAVSVNFIVLATDERDYLYPLSDYVSTPNSARLPIIQNRLDGFCANLNLIASLALPTSLVRTTQVELLEREIYKPYPSSYLDAVKAAAKEINGTTNQELTRAVIEGEESYRRQFARGGLYEKFLKEEINFQVISLLRTATYGLQMATILETNDVVFDTVTSPSPERSAMMNRVIKQAGKPGEVQTPYSQFGSRKELRKLLYE